MPEDFAPGSIMVFATQMSVSELCDIVVALDD